MKKIFVIALLFAAVFSVNAAEVTVLSLSGTVEVREPGAAWRPLAVNQVVSSNSMVSTGFGARAKLSIGGMEVSLQPLTRVTIDSLTQDGDTSRTAMSLQSGRVRATRPPVTRSTRSNLDFRVSTPVATAAVRGTDFELSFNKLVTDEGLVGLSQGQAAVLSPGGTWSWAVEGLRPVNPAGLISEKWSVSSTAGTLPGSNGGSSGSRSNRNLGTTRLTLQ